MTPADFTKTYDTAEHAEIARAQHKWLTGLDGGIAMPALLKAAGTELTFEHLHGYQPEPDDLPAVAAALGNLHAAAYTQHLHAARLDEPFVLDDGVVLPDFFTPRSLLPDLLPRIAELPVALYKDANIRNFLVTTDGVAVVDFDDLGLAPFGYDLAKLVVSAAMTHGRLDAGLTDAVLLAYNAATAAAGADLVCPLHRFQLFTELHHEYTRPYLHQHGYCHSWDDVRPWRTTARLEDHPPTEADGKLSTPKHTLPTAPGSPVTGRGNPESSKPIATQHGQRGRSAIATLFPTKAMVLQACAGTVLPPHPLLLAAFELARLHEAGLDTTNEQITEIDTARAQLVHDIDSWVSAHTPQPVNSAPLHSETLGTIVNRLAQFYVEAHTAVEHDAPESQRQHLWQRMAELASAYADLSFEASTGHRRLPDTA